MESDPTGGRYVLENEVSVSQKKTVDGPLDKVVNITLVVEGTFYRYLLINAFIRFLFGWSNPLPTPEHHPILSLVTA